MIQTIPLSSTENMREYAEMLLIRYVQPHYQAGALVVHVIFDNPRSLPESPKILEQSRRDSAKAKELASHKCVPFTSITSVPGQWSTMLEFPCSFMNVLIPDQEFVTNIKGTAKGTSIDKEIITRPTLSSNIDEADMRIWLHCVQLAAEFLSFVQILIMSDRLNTASFSTRETSNSAA